MEPAHDRVKSVLARHPGIQLGILFGSRAAARETASSDLDVAVAADRLLGPREKMALIDDLAQTFGCPVDLVDLNAVTGLILHQALTKGEVLLNRKPSLLANLILKMWYNQADVMPNYRMILKKRVEAFAHG